MSSTCIGQVNEMIMLMMMMETHSVEKDARMIAVAATCI